jgi:hypothetical protein
METFLPSGVKGSVQLPATAEAAFHESAVWGPLQRRETGMKSINILAILLAGMAINSAGLHSQTLARYECNSDCSGREAGYRWAEHHEITKAAKCAVGTSKSFQEGCLAYVEEIRQGADVQSKSLRGPL